MTIENQDLHIIYKDKDGHMAFVLKINNSITVTNLNQSKQSFVEYAETDNFKCKIITPDVFNRYDYYGRTMTYDKMIIIMDGHDYIGPDHYV